MKRHRGNLYHVFLSEIIQSENTIYGMISTIWHCGKCKTIKKPGVGGKEGINRWNSEESEVWETTLHNTIMVKI